MGKASQTGGVKPMTIAGRLINERERLLGMTEAERQFRKQWLKDQELAPNEPRVVPALQRSLQNPIKRFYRWPLDQVGKLLFIPMLGESRGTLLRYMTGKVAIGLVLLYSGWYTLKYHGNEWERKGGWKIYTSRKAVLPGDPGYPKLTDRTKPSDYANQHFDQCDLDL